jgi:cell division control protein 45
MYLPRQLISHLYLQLLRSHHPLSPPVLILVALEPDALCACRILTALLKRDYIPHKIHPVAGYGDLSRAGEELVRPMQTKNGGSGGVVVCLGVGGLVDLGEILGLSGEDNDDATEEDMGGVEVWVFDARRPWNLANVFGGQTQVLADVDGNASTAVARRQQTRGVEKGRVTVSYKNGGGGIVVYDDGDIEEEMGKEREAYCALMEMPEVDEDEEDDDDEDQEPPSSTDSKKRKSWSREDDDEDEELQDDEEPPRQRRRSNSVRLHLP